MFVYSRTCSLCFGCKVVKCLWFSLVDMSLQIPDEFCKDCNTDDLKTGLKQAVLKKMSLLLLLSLASHLEPETRSIFMILQSTVRPQHLFIFAYMVKILYVSKQMSVSVNVTDSKLQQAHTVCSLCPLCMTAECFPSPFHRCHSFTDFLSFSVIITLTCLHSVSPSSPFFLCALNWFCYFCSKIAIFVICTHTGGQACRWEAN